MRHRLRAGRLTLALSRLERYLQQHYRRQHRQCRAVTAAEVTTANQIYNGPFDTTNGADAWSSGTVVACLLPSPAVRERGWG
jgi:hypothetical protein